MAARLVPRTWRERLLTVLLIAALCEIAWAVYLGWTLPRHYVVHHWALTWVGLDVGEVAMLLSCAWAAWRQRAMLIAFSVAAGTMFLLDAWFDVTSAGRGGELESVLLAVFGEIPAALLLLWVARRAAIRLFAIRLPRDASDTALRKVLLVDLDEAKASERPPGEES